MPYIKEDERFGMIIPEPMTPGQLNYAVTMAVAHWLDAAGRNYTNINAAIGVLECAKLELYRRVATPYEDSKCAENGDVYPKSLTEIRR